MVRHSAQKAGAGTHDPIVIRPPERELLGDGIIPEPGTQQAYPQGATGLGRGAAIDFEVAQVAWVCLVEFTKDD